MDVQKDAVAKTLFSEEAFIIHRFTKIRDMAVYLSARIIARLSISLSSLRKGHLHWRRFWTKTLRKPQKPSSLLSYIYRNVQVLTPTC
jgi:hypothetical protein